PMQSPTMTSSSGSLGPRVPPTPMAPLGYAKPGKRLPLPDRRGQGHAEGVRVKADLTEVEKGASHMLAAVDGKLGAADVARLLGAPEIHGLGHILRLPEPAHRAIGDQRLGAWRQD